MARNGQRLMVTWADHIDEVSAEEGACVLLVPINGSELEQRAHRRALALNMAEIAFGRTGLTIGSTEEGALRFFENGNPVPLYLSHATRGGFSAIAVAREPVGVDLELLQPTFEPAWNILHEREKALLENFGNNDSEKSARHQAFLKIWTGKEACLKLEGQGLLTDPSLLEVMGSTARNHANGASFKLHYFETGHLIACLAVRDESVHR